MTNNEEVKAKLATAMSERMKEFWKQVHSGEKEAPVRNYNNAGKGQYLKDYWKPHPDKIPNYRKYWYEKNREHVLELQREYEKRKREEMAAVKAFMGIIWA